MLRETTFAGGSGVKLGGGTQHPTHRQGRGTCLGPVLVKPPDRLLTPGPHRYLE